MELYRKNGISKKYETIIISDAPQGNYQVECRNTKTGRLAWVALLDKDCGFRNMLAELGDAIGWYFCSLWFEKNPFTDHVIVYSYAEPFIRHNLSTSCTYASSYGKRVVVEDYPGFVYVEYRSEATGRLNRACCVEYVDNGKDGAYHRPLLTAIRNKQTVFLMDVSAKEYVMPLV